MKKHLQDFLKREFPEAEMDVSCQRGKYGISYYGGDESFSQRVKQTVAEFFEFEYAGWYETPGLPAVWFKTPSGVYVECDWHPEGKALGRVIYSTVTHAERDDIYWEGRAVHILRVHLSCGHYVEQFPERNKKYAVEQDGPKRRMECRTCTAEDNERERRKHEDFLKSIEVNR